MTQTKIVKAPKTNRGFFTSSTKNTDISQRVTLEEIIINLSASLGIETVYKQENSRGAYFYEVQASGFSGFQSASNTILELSRKLSCNEQA
ncbi:MAG: hypothetical protein K8H75_11835 [Sulfuricella sp.]|nr:hypothetical protein [Sulfuricella sp.]